MGEDDYRLLVTTEGFWYDSIESGQKKFDFRKGIKEINVGDIVCFMEAKKREEKHERKIESPIVYLSPKQVMDIRVKLGEERKKSFYEHYGEKIGTEFLDEDKEN